MVRHAGHERSREADDAPRLEGGQGAVVGDLRQAGADLRSFRLVGRHTSTSVRQVSSRSEGVGAWPLRPASAATFTAPAWSQKSWNVVPAPEVKG